MNTTSKQSNMTDQDRLEQLERKVELLEKVLHPLFGKPRKAKPTLSMQLVSKQLEKLIRKHKPRNAGK